MIASLFCLVLVAAGPDQERAELFFEAGNVAYQRGQYVEAVQAFEDAYRLLPQPEIAFSLAQALRRKFAVGGDAADAKRAIALFREYLERAPHGRRRPEAAEQIEALSRVSLARTSTAAVQASPAQTHLMLFSEIDGVSASIDGGPFEPLTLVARVEPGERIVNARADGFQEKRFKVLAIAGQKTAVKVDLVERPGLMRVEAPEGARIFVDGTEVAEAPLAVPLSFSPGAHRVVVSSPGHYPFIDTVTLLHDREELVRADLAITVQRKLAHGVLGATGASALCAAIATGLALRWESRAQELDQTRRMGNADAEVALELEDEIGRRNTARAVAIGTWISSVVLGSLSAALYLTD